MKNNTKLTIAISALAVSAVAGASKQLLNYVKKQEEKRKMQQECGRLKKQLKVSTVMDYVDQTDTLEKLGENLNNAKYLKNVENFELLIAELKKRNLLKENANLPTTENKTNETKEIPTDTTTPVPPKIDQTVVDSILNPEPIEEVCEDVDQRPIEEICKDVEENRAINTSDEMRFIEHILNQKGIYHIFKNTIIQATKSYKTITHKCTYLIFTRGGVYVLTRVYTDTGNIKIDQSNSAIKGIANGKEVNIENPTLNFGKFINTVRTQLNSMLTKEKLKNLSVAGYVIFNNNAKANVTQVTKPVVTNLKEFKTMIEKQSNVISEEAFCALVETISERLNNNSNVFYENISNDLIGSFSKKKALA